MFLIENEWKTATFILYQIFYDKIDLSYFRDVVLMLLMLIYCAKKIYYFQGYAPLQKYFAAKTTKAGSTKKMGIRIETS